MYLNDDPELVGGETAFTQVRCCIRELKSEFHFPQSSRAVMTVSYQCCQSAFC